MALYCSEECLEDYEEQLLEQQILNETYFGRTPGIMKCFDAFCDYRHKYVNNNILKSRLGAQTDPDLERFCVEMEREFGFDSFSFMAIPGEDVNAFTIGNLYGNPSDIEVTRTGYKFKKEAKVGAIVASFQGLLFNAEYTDEEMFATLLHEIGHNFSASANPIMCGTTIADTLITSVDCIVNQDYKRLAVYLGAQNKLIKKLTAKWFRKVSNENPITTQFLMAYEFIVNTYFAIMQELGFFRMLPKLVSTVMKRVLSMFKMPLTMYKGYMDERFADAFPAYYGFGTDLATTLNKFGKRNSFSRIANAVGNIPIVGHITNLMFFPLTRLLVFSDVHPDTIERCKSTLNALKEDLKDPGLRPQARKQLEQDIKDFENKMNHILETESKIGNPHVVDAIYNKFMWNKTTTGGPKMRALDPTQSFHKLTNKMKKVKNESYDYISDTEIV